MTAENSSGGQNEILSFQIGIHIDTRANTMMQIVILSMWPDRMAMQYWPKLGLSRPGNPALAKYTHKL